MHEALYRIYAFVDLLGKREQLWLQFIDDPFWKECGRKRPKETDRHDEQVMWASRFMFNATETKGALYNRVQKYAATLRRFASEDVAPEDVIVRLKDKGVDYAFSGNANDGDDGADDDKVVRNAPHHRRDTKAGAVLFHPNRGPKPKVLLSRETRGQSAARSMSADDAHSNARSDDASDWHRVSPRGRDIRREPGTGYRSGSKGQS